MAGLLTFIMGIIVLILGIPIGNFLSRVTKEEIKDGQIWFRTLSILSIVFAVVSLIIGNDPLLFGFLFVLIITSRSLKNK